MGRFERDIKPSFARNLRSRWACLEEAKEYLLNQGYKFVLKSKCWRHPATIRQPNFYNSGNPTAEELSALCYLHYIHDYGWYC